MAGARKPGEAAVPDPREGEDWFQRLPEAAREEMRAAWRRREEQAERRLWSAATERRRTMAGAALLFGAAHLLLVPPSLLRPPLVALAGACVGWLWFRYRMGRFQTMATGTVVHVTLCALAGDYAAVSPGSAGHDARVLGVLFPMLSVVVMAHLCAWLGQARERLPGS